VAEMFEVARADKAWRGSRVDGRGFNFFTTHRCVRPSSRTVRGVVCLIRSWEHKILRDQAHATGTTIIYA
jgi:hypothetical protein